MPFDDPTLNHTKDEYQDHVRLTGGDSGPWLMLHYNDREVAFWKKLPRAHRDVLSGLGSWQLGAAGQVLDMRREYKSGATEEQWNQLYNTQYRAPMKHGFPTEAFGDDALLWCYVVNKRRDYQELVRQGHGTNDVAIEKFKQELPVDAKYLTEPPDAEVQKRANAWKFAYLRRLRSQKIHEPYMDAYLKAWNLNPGEVFTNVAVLPQPIP